MDRERLFLSTLEHAGFPSPFLSSSSIPSSPPSLSCSFQLPLYQTRRVPPEPGLGSRRHHAATRRPPPHTFPPPNLIYTQSTAVSRPPSTPPELRGFPKIRGAGIFTFFFLRCSILVLFISLVFRSGGCVCLGLRQGRLRNWWEGEEGEDDGARVFGLCYLCIESGCLGGERWL